jgi:hypothetical protein
MSSFIWMLPVVAEGAGRTMFSKYNVSALVVVSNTLMGVAAGVATCDAAGEGGSALVGDLWHVASHQHTQMVEPATVPIVWIN